MDGKDVFVDNMMNIYEKMNNDTEREVFLITMIEHIYDFIQEIKNLKSEFILPVTEWDKEVFDSIMAGNGFEVFEDEEEDEEDEGVSDLWGIY